MLAKSVRTLALAAVLVMVGCTSTDGDDARSRSNAPTDDGRPRAFDVGPTGALASPTFVWLARRDWPKFESAAASARAVVRAVAPTLHLDDGALASIAEPVVHEAKRGPIVAHLAQEVEGVDVFRGGLRVMLNRAFEPIAMSGLVAPSIARSPSGFAKDAAAALGIAHQRMTGARATFSALDVDGAYQRFTASAGPAARAPGRYLDQPARAKRVYFPSKGGLEAAWYVEIFLASGAARSYVVSAITGRVLFTNDLVRHDAYAYRVWASPDSKLPMDGPQGNLAVPLVTPARGDFKPTFVPQELVTIDNYPFSKNDPWLPANATTTSGNNVAAYSDVVRPNGLSPNTADTGAEPSGPATIDYVYDTRLSAGKSPEAVKAAVTQMFFVTNFLHDWFYDAGFDEKSGNHQIDNFGRGGRGNDALRAETQDYSGRNNANAATPADGASPRIQMFLFGGPTIASLDVASPAPVAGTKRVGTAGQFGKDSFALTAEVVLASDGRMDPADACEPLEGSIAGKIALVHRGTCSFVQKAQNVQAAGAVGLIISNIASSAQPNTPPFMGGTASDVAIPLLSLSLADGQALEAALPSGVSVTMKREPTVDLDGALDNQIVSHEWGHVLSNRLVADGSGLDTNMGGGLGEGWADFVAMMLAVRADDITVPSNANWAGVYPSGSYATSGDGDFYFGIRRVPYSTDLTKDPLTFKHISNGVPLPREVEVSFGEDGSFNAEVHNTGEVWATMLWECYAALLRDARYTFAEAQERMKAYLVSSLKLTPPSPTLLEARDAVLAAAYATDDKDFGLFWQAFANRGAGVGALGPARDSTDNTGVVESFVVGNAMSLVGSTVSDDAITCDHDGILDEGEVGTIEITVRNSGAGALEEATAKLIAKIPNVGFADGGVVRFDSFKPFETKSARIRTWIDGPSSPQPIPIEITVSDPSLVANGSVQLQVPARHAVDEVASSSKRDTVETKSTPWVVAGKDETGTSQKWSRVAEKANLVWFIPNAGEPADHTLTSPTLRAEKTKLDVSFRHRWSFETSEEDHKDFDGGVVELSIDDGKTWKDISTYGAIDYNVTLVEEPETTMVLKGRKAFGHDSPGYPDTWHITRVTAELPEAGASVKIRFRAGSDENTASVGWEIDDIEIGGIENTPFPSFEAHRDECDPAGPTADAGTSRSVLAKSHVVLEGSATHPKGLPLQFSWRQVAGPKVALANAASAALSFDAPDVTEPVTLTFALRAHDGALLSAASTVDVTVTPASDETRFLSADGGGCGCKLAGSHAGGDSNAAALLAALGALGLVVGRRRARP